MSLFMSMYVCVFDRAESDIERGVIVFVCVREKKMCLNLLVYYE